MNHSQNGVEIQFYLLLTLVLLLLKLKQDCQDVGFAPKAGEKAGEKSAEKGEKRQKREESPPEWIKNIGKIFYESWKISKDWLLIVRNSLGKVMDTELLTLLNSC